MLPHWDYKIRISDLCFPHKWFLLDGADTSGIPQNKHFYCFPLIKNGTLKSFIDNWKKIKLILSLFARRSLWLYMIFANQNLQRKTSNICMVNKGLTFEIYFKNSTCQLNQGKMVFLECMQKVPLGVIVKGIIYSQRFLRHFWSYRL